MLISKCKVFYLCRRYLASTIVYHIIGPAYKYAVAIQICQILCPNISIHNGLSSEFGVIVIAFHDYRTAPGQKCR